MYQDLHFYIDLDWEKHINEPDYLKNISSFINIAYLHKANVHYSKHQRIDFIKNCNDLYENYIVSIAEKLDVILENAQEIDNQRYIFEICFSNENTSLKHITNMIISSLKNFPKQLIVSSKLCNNELLAIESNTKFEKINITYSTDIQDIIKWIVNNSHNRSFHISPKHGENGVGNWRGESVLLCNQAQAFHLLQSAIPDCTEKENRLFNWDDTHETFIEFFFEGENPQMQWHGFHLKSEDWRRVPNSVRKFFGK